MSKLILVRHSSPEIVPIVPANQWHLSEEGRLRCAFLADRLAVYHPNVIVTSIEPKAVETTQIVANLLGTPFETADGLHEHDRSNVGLFGSKEQFEEAVAGFFEARQKLVLGRETA